MAEGMALALDKKDQVTTLLFTTSHIWNYSDSQNLVVYLTLHGTENWHQNGSSLKAQTQKNTEVKTKINKK